MVLICRDDGGCRFSVENIIPTGCKNNPKNGLFKKCHSAVRNGIHPHVRQVSRGVCGFTLEPVSLKSVSVNAEGVDGVTLESALFISYTGGMDMRIFEALIKKIPVAIFFTGLVLISCGDQEKKNNAPVITAFTADYIGTDSSYFPSKLYSGMPFLIKVTAADPDNNPLSMSISSNQGTFSKAEAASGVFSYKFYIGVIAGGEKVSVSAVITDSKGTSISQSLDIGTGKSCPEMTISQPSPSTIPSDGSATFVMSFDSGGFYRVYLDNTISSAAEAVLGDSVNLYRTENKEITVKLVGPQSSESGIVLQNGSNNIWIVFKDYNGQTVVGSRVITVN
jgi:hypothetical protein